MNISVCLFTTVPQTENASKFKNIHIYTLLFPCWMREFCQIIFMDSCTWSHATNSSCSVLETGLFRHQIYLSMIYLTIFLGLVSGHYLLAEASGRYRLDRSRVLSPSVTFSEEYCLRFYYHIYGESVGSLEVFSGILITSK